MGERTIEEMERFSKRAREQNQLEANLFQLRKALDEEEAGPREMVRIISLKRKISAAQERVKELAASLARRQGIV